MIIPALSPLQILLVLLSPAVGSFLAVLYTRLPGGHDVISARSTCHSCGAHLQARDLIPLLSYLFLRGKCRHCTAEIPAILPLLEVAALTIALLVVWHAPSDSTALLGMSYLWCLLTLGVIDLHYFRLPDPLTAALFVIGMGLAWVDPTRTLLDASLAALAGAAAFLAIRLGYQALRHREGLGLGDVKLMTGLGAGLGVLNLPLAVLFAALSALLWALFQAGFKGASLQGKTALPFGSFLCLAGAAIWLWQA